MAISRGTGCTPPVHTPSLPRYMLGYTPGGQNQWHSPTRLWKHYLPLAVGKNWNCKCYLTQKVDNGKLKLDTMDSKRRNRFHTILFWIPWYQRFLKTRICPVSMATNNNKMNSDSCHGLPTDSMVREDKSNQNCFWYFMIDLVPEPSR